MQDQSNNLFNDQYKDDEIMESIQEEEIQPESQHSTKKTALGFYVPSTNQIIVKSTELAFVDKLAGHSDETAVAEIISETEEDANGSEGKCYGKKAELAEIDTEN